MPKDTISFTVESGMKKKLDNYAIGRGFRNAGALSRAALFVYIRQRSPKEAGKLLLPERKPDENI